MEIEDLTATLGGAAGFAVRYFAILAGVGGLAMALIEAGKTLFDWRARFQAGAVKDWICRTGQFLSMAADGTGEPQAPDALTELLHLTTGVSIAESHAAAVRLLEGRIRGFGMFGLTVRAPEYAVFALDIDRLCGHIQDAAEASLAAPDRFPHLFRFFTEGAAEDDVAGWREMSGEPVALLDTLVDRPEIARQAKQRADVYARLSQAAKRRLDTFQLYTGERWSNTMQVAANLTGVVLLFGLLVAPLWPENWWDALRLVALSLLGGILAPVAKDLVVALQRLRTP
jgi:hypothetical protein